MRLTLRARQVLALAVVVLLVVVASTVAHLANVARLALGAAVDEGELMAKQLYHQSSRVVAAAPAPSPALLQQDPGIRALLEGMVGYSRTVVYAAVVDPTDRVLAHSNPKLEGEILPARESLERLKARSTLGIVASFFVVCGADRMGRRLGRLVDPRFVWKLVRTRVVATYGWRTLLSGTLLRARPVAAAFPETLRALASAGHDVGVHGYDHARWQDRLPRLHPAEVADEVERATAVLRDILGAAPHGFAAPGWRCTPASLAAVDAAGFACVAGAREAAPLRRIRSGAIGCLRVTVLTQC